MTDEDIENLKQYVHELNGDALQMDGYDDCIIGVAKEGGRYLLAYSEQKIIDRLRSDNEMEYEEAVEYYEFNIAGAYMGDGTPVIVDLRNG